MLRGQFYCIVVVCFLLHLPLRAQFYVNMDAGPKWDVVQTFASKGSFMFNNKADFMGGARLGYEVNPYLAFEIGAYVHQLNNNYTYRLDGVDWLTDEQWLPAQMLQFPIRLRTTVFTVGEKLSFHPYLGIAFLIHRHQTGRYEWRFQQQPIEDPTHQSSFKYEYNASFKSRYLLLGEAGIMTHYKISKHFNICLTIGFTMGSTSMHESQLSWQRKTPSIDDEGVLNAQYKGDQISLMLGVQCLFKE